MRRKSRLDWEKPMAEDALVQEVEGFLGRNVPLSNPRDDQPQILGFPVGEPDSFGINMHSLALKRNPNNIGLHTTDNEAEEGFQGTQHAEKLFIGMMADLLDADLTKVDGYIEAGGSTANMAGLLIGRNRTHLRDEREKPLKNSKNKTAVLCSHITHYSIVQNASNLGIGEMTNIGKGDGTGVHLIGTDEDGHVLLSQLEERLRDLLKNHPDISNIIIVGNAGTTMLGSVDNIPGINELIGQFKERFPDKIFHFHIDAAHGGLIAPFLPHLPQIGFSNDHVDTITIDPHKMGKVGFGCGVILAKKGYFDWIASECPYVPGGSRTISGSRSGAVAIGAYAAFRRRGKEGVANYAQTLRNLTWEVRGKIANLGIEIFGSDLNIVAAKTELPSEIKKEFIVHGDDRMPVDMSNPDGRERRSVWNIVVMEHVQKGIRRFEEAYRTNLKKKSL
jgi:glutamate/tyrosine decarboxylase-like PLP-dependent enzyme